MTTYLFEINGEAVAVLRAGDYDTAVRFARKEAGFGELFSVREIKDYGDVAGGADVADDEGQGGPR